MSRPSTRLLDDYLPIPSVQWKHRDVDLRTTAQSFGERGERLDASDVRQLKNKRQDEAKVDACAVVRPLQVNPPAQFLNTAAVSSPIKHFALRTAPFLSTTCRSIIPQSAPRDSLRRTIRCRHAVRMVEINESASSDHGRNRLCLRRAAVRRRARAERTADSCSICRCIRAARLRRAGWSTSRRPTKHGARN